MLASINARASKSTHEIAQYFLKSINRNQWSQKISAWSLLIHIHRSRSAPPRNHSWVQREQHMKLSTLSKSLFSAALLVSIASTTFAQDFGRDRNPGRGGPGHGEPDRGGPDRGAPDRGHEPDRGGPGRGPGREPDRGPGRHPTPPPPRRANDTLYADQSLYTNQSISSRNGRYFLLMQGDCNLVLYREGFRGNNQALWSSRTDRRGRNCRAIMQGDGNFVVYEEYGRPVFNTRTDRNPGSILVLQDDGNLVMYQGNRVMWASGTNERFPR